MPSFVHPVHLTRSAPFDIDAGQLVFYDVVDHSAMSRSSVLSCVAEAGGEATLPDSVTVCDFRQWLAAAADSHAEFRGRPFAFMCTAIKVADAVDDKHIDEWVRTAASKLVHKATSSCSKDVRQSMAEDLCILSEHLQHRIFAAAVRHSQTVNKLLSFLPVHLHAPVLAASITPERMLRMILDEDSVLALEALGTMPASPPSVLSFCVQRDRSIKHMRRLEKCPEVDACLAGALQHHTGLTCLLLRSSSIQVASQQLLPAVASLTSLRSVALDKSCPTSAESAPLLQQTLQALPHLHHLELHLTEEAAASGRKRQRDTEEAAVPHSCLAAMLSPATALTCLSLCTSRPGVAQHRATFTTMESLSLPRLLKLTALFDLEENAQLSASFFTHLSAPLTSLHLAEGLQRPEHLPSAAAPAVRQLLHSLAAFTQLRSFSVALPTDTPDRRIRSDAPNENSVFVALTFALPSFFAPLRRLQSLAIAAEPALAQSIVPLLVAAAAPVALLRLGFYHPHALHSQNRPSSVTWPDFFQALCQLKLQHLDLDWQDRSPTRHGIAALQPLTALTALRVSGWACLASRADWDALAGMTRLQQLCIDHTNDDFKLQQDYIALLRALSALTSLTLMTSEEDDRLVPSLAAHLPPQSLPVLRELAVAVYDPFYTAEALVSYAGTLPALKQLTVHLMPSADIDEPQPEYLGRGRAWYEGGSLSDDDDPEADLRRYEELLKRTNAIQARLKSAAASAGVKLRVVRDEVDNLR